MLKRAIGVLTLAGIFASPALSEPNLTPIRLRAGSNPIPNIAGDGKSGSISLDWRENGNAWSYDIYTVRVGGSIATVEGQDRFTDQPHTGDDIITSVRFARGSYIRGVTTFALVADREIVNSVPEPARTTIKIYALRRNGEGVGTPYEFVKVRTFQTTRRYCNADMALQSELGFPVAQSYSGARTIDGCYR